MSTIDRLDRMHEQYANEPKGSKALEAACKIAGAWPAVRAYIVALEEERDASREVMRHRDRMLWLCDENTGEDIEAVRVTRLATDAAREKMEKQDG